MSWQVQEMEDLQLNNLIDLYKDGLETEGDSRGTRTWSRHC
jgi:hypothetical protein